MKPIFFYVIALWMFFSCDSEIIENPGSQTLKVPDNAKKIKSDALEILKSLCDFWEVKNDYSVDVKNTKQIEIRSGGNQGFVDIPLDLNDDSFFQEELTLRLQNNFFEALLNSSYDFSHRVSDYEWFSSLNHVTKFFFLVYRSSLVLFEVKEKGCSIFEHKSVFDNKILAFNKKEYFFEKRSKIKSDVLEIVDKISSFWWKEINYEVIVVLVEQKDNELKFSKKSGLENEYYVFVSIGRDKDFYSKTELSFLIQAKFFENIVHDFDSFRDYLSQSEKYSKDFICLLDSSDEMDSFVMVEDCPGQALRRFLLYYSSIRLLGLDKQELKEFFKSRNWNLFSLEKKEEIVKRIYKTENRLLMKKFKEYIFNDKFQLESKSFFLEQEKGHMCD